VTHIVRAATFLFVIALTVPVMALEVRVRAETSLEVDVTAAGTVAQVAGSLRDDLGRGVPQRSVEVRIDSRRTGEAVLSRTVHTGPRGRFGVQEELPPGGYEVFVRFADTEHLDGNEHSASLRLEPKPVDIRAFGPSLVFGRSHPAWVSGRAMAGRVPYQEFAEVLVGEEVVGRMELDATGRGTFDVAPHLETGINQVTLRTPGSAYRDPSQASVDIRFADDVQVEAKIEEGLERLQRGVSVQGRVYDAGGPLEGVRVRTVIRSEALVDEEAEERTFTARTTTDSDGRYVGFVPATKLGDGRWRGTAEFVPPIGERIQVDAGSVEIDTRAYRWAMNGFGLVAIFAGMLVLLARVGQAFRARWRKFRRRVERERRERAALEEVEEIVPVFFDPDELEESVVLSRDDVGGVVWDVWQSKPVAGASVALRSQGGAMEATSDANGRFRFEDVPEGAWQLVVRKHGFVRGNLEMEVPHDGRMSHFRVDVIAVPLKIRRLYGAVVEHSIGEDLWGRLSPREIEEQLESLWPDSEGEGSEARRELRARVLSQLQRDESDQTSPTAVLAALTEVVEEAYFSGRTYGEEAFLFARQLALELRARAGEGP
jgi:hypothetical protein